MIQVDSNRGVLITMHWYLRGTRYITDTYSRPSASYHGIVSYERDSVMNQSLFFAPKLHKMIAVIVLLITTLLISPVMAGVLDDDVPREKAKMPKLKPPL